MKGKKKSVRSDLCRREGDSSTLGGSESPSVVTRALLSPFLALPPSCPLILGWSSPFQNPPSHLKKCWELPRCPNSPSKPAPRSGDKAGDTGGHQCPPGLPAWPGPVTSNQFPKNSSLVLEGNPEPIPGGKCGTEGTSECPCPCHSHTGAKIPRPPPAPGHQNPQATPRPPSGDTATHHDVPRDAGIALPPHPRPSQGSPPSFSLPNPSGKSNMGNFPAEPGSRLALGQGHRARSPWQSG